MNRWLYAAVGIIVALLLTAACNDGDDGNGTLSETPTVGETPAVVETPLNGGANADIKMISGKAFDKSELTIAADTEVAITADNTDGLHSFAVFAGEEYAPGLVEPLAGTEACFSPCTVTLSVNLTPGEYVFRCQVHPEEMAGTLIAQQERY